MRNMTELDMYLFGQSTHYDIYRKMGAHPMKTRKEEYLEMSTVGRGIWQEN